MSNFGTSGGVLGTEKVGDMPLRNWTRLFGNLEGWVQSGEARRWTMRAVLPSISASCYASIHTGVSPQVHGCTGNGNVFRLSHPDVFSQVRAGGGVTGAVAPRSRPLRPGLARCRPRT